MSEFSQKKLKDLIESGSVGYRQNSRSYIFTCPLCNKKDKLYMMKSTGKFVCFVCAESERRFRGRPEFALAELFNWTVSEAKRRLYGDDHDGKTPDDLLNFKIYDFYGEYDEIVEDVSAMLPTISWPIDYFPIDDPKSVRGLKYLEDKRGVSLQLAKDHHLRYCPTKRRVAFPIEVDGRLVGWQARSIIPTEWIDKTGVLRSTPKILGNDGLVKGMTLMFGDNLKGSDHAMICEGPLDGIKASLCGGVVVTMGKAVSEAQIKIIRKSGVKNIYLALDPDASVEMRNLCHIFGDLRVFQVLPSPGLKDLGDMTPEAILSRFKSAKRVDSNSVFLYLRY